MLDDIKKIFKKKNLQNKKDIAPDEIFLDSQNLPDFDTDQLEGRLEKPIAHSVRNIIGLCILFVAVIFISKLWNLEIVQGQVFLNRSDNNSLHTTPVFADRGVIYDRNGSPLVWNTVNPATSDFSLREYATSTGLSTVLGYVKYPTKDSSGIYYQNEIDAKDGVEKIYNNTLAGVDGSKIVETDVKGNVVSESIIQPPQDGNNLTLSIDIDLQRELTKSLLDIENKAGFKGGAGAIMDVHTGEILASSQFPQYDSQVMTDGSDSAQINEWITDNNYPFLNHVIDGLYTPGSVMKLFEAMGVLDQHVIDPNTKILSTGSISIPNPFDPAKPSVFMDWRPQGWVDLEQALAVSSDVYFYEVTGGYQNQKGIGIANIEKYVRMFGFGTTTGINFPGEQDGTIPDPAWKAANFNGEEWRVGDTYNTAIGQYGFQVSPLQVVRGVAAIANGGTLLTPTFLKPQSASDVSNIVGKINLDPSYFQIVKDGMRLGVTDGTSEALNLPFVTVASKTGTAQLGILKDETNSWVVGFWPYDNPKYAYAIVMERGSITNEFGAALVMQDFFNQAEATDPQYLQE